MSKEEYALKKEAAKRWVSELKPGDKVLYIGHTNKPENILDVVKVTPTGVVRTNNGSYKQPDWTDTVLGYGKTCGCIVPLTDDGAQQAKSYIKSIIEIRMRDETIRIAKQLCYSVYAGTIGVPYDLALKIIELLTPSEKSDKQL